MDKSAFFTRKQHNEPRKIPLYTPEGEETEHFLMVLGSLSDKFRQSNIDAQRKILAQDLSQEEMKRVQDELIASAVVSWSFNEPCTVKNVVSFFRDAPQIFDEVNSFVGTMSNFLEKKSKPSTRSRKTTSN